MTYDWESIENRPYYTKFAFAYDQLIIRPIQEHCQFLHNYFIENGFSTESKILDAGCGTGGYAVELAKHGYNITGIDLSPDQIKVAKQKAIDQKIDVTFTNENILNHTTDNSYDIILCRGVLNDILDDTTRQSFFNHFYSLLTKGGLLIVDVRDWELSKKQILKNPNTSKEIKTTKVILEVKSQITLNESNQSYDIYEEYTLSKKRLEVVDRYNLTMRCWTQATLNNTFEKAGFNKMTYLGDFNKKSPVGSSVYLIGLGYKA